MGNETSNQTSTPATEALETLALRLAKTAQYLAERVETERRLSERIMALERQQTGELAAPLFKKMAVG